LIIFTGGGFLISIVPSLAGLVILGRRVSGLVIVDPFTAIHRISKNTDYMRDKRKVMIIKKKTAEKRT
jgi:hypothetical protein